MTNLEWVKTLSQREFALWLGCMMARTVDDEDFGKWVLIRERYQKWASEWLACKHKENTDNV